VDPDGWLTTAAAVEVLEAGRVPVVASPVATSVDDAAVAASQLGYPVAVKSLGRSRLAKSEVAGLALDVHDEAELRATVARMERALGPGALPVVVQPMVEPGVDVAVGVAVHPLVGPVLTVGPGGVATPLAAAQAHVVPLTDTEARAFVDGLAFGALLEDPVREHLVDLLLRVSALVDQVPELTGVDLNPVMLSPAGAAIVDARVRAAAVDRNPLPPVRRL
jgi:hypothetical protein